MTVRKKDPGGALQRAIGADQENEGHRQFLASTYATCTDLQRRYVMRRCGVGSLEASVIATLFFGERER